MAETLAQQFPHFPEVVAAFGYPSVALDGWEADDVIATVAARAEEAGLTTCLRSTDRDAFQLVTEATCLMMTPRGVAEPQVYTPERVLRRYGIGPARTMAHLPISGESGSLRRLARLNATHRYYTHINNTNPVLDEASPEHLQLRLAGWEVATDGLRLRV